LEIGSLCGALDPNKLALGMGWPGGGGGSIKKLDLAIDSPDAALEYGECEASGDGCPWAGHGEESPLIRCDWMHGAPPPDSVADGG
jgi:hypothetical protein